VKHSTRLPHVSVLDIGPASWGLVQMLRGTYVPPSRLNALSAAALLVAGCANIPDVGADVATTGMPNTEVALRESMRLVDAEVGKLGRMAPLPPVRADAYPVVPGELQRPISFAWAGTLEDGVRRLAGNIGYATAVAPPQPGQESVPVSISVGPVPVIEAFQALGDAAGARATVRVDPVRRQVDVLYHA